MNDSKRKSPSDFTAKLHHRSNAYQRKSEIIKGKNILALEMLERALDNGIDADYLLVDSWYAKPNFIKEANCKNRSKPDNDARVRPDAKTEFNRTVKRCSTGH
jgi:hypothetical protein